MHPRTRACLPRRLGPSGPGRRALAPFRNALIGPRPCDATACDYHGCSSRSSPRALQHYRSLSSCCFTVNIMTRAHTCCRASRTPRHRTSRPPRSPSRVLKAFLRASPHLWLPVSNPSRFRRATTYKEPSSGESRLSTTRSSTPRAAWEPSVGGPRHLITGTPPIWAPTWIGHLLILP